MRKIKFRAWDIKNKRMLYDLNYIQWDPPMVSSEGGNCEYFYLEQYTGLKDINGKEIYEGDIVRVYIDYGPAGIKEVELVVVIDSFGVNIQKWVYDEGKLPEVIGNTHEEVRM